MQHKLKSGTLLMPAVACMLMHAATAGIAQKNTLTTGRYIAERGCPTSEELDLVLRKAGAELDDSRFLDVSKDLKPLSQLKCDFRVDLLLSAAFEGSGNLLEAEQSLQEAHAIWPANTAIATTLAREYLSENRPQKAASALDHFRPAPSTPWQEIQVAGIVYLTNHQLAAAETLAKAGYKAYPSIDSLLLWANVLQLEGRYKDVIAALNAERGNYNDSSSFLITLAESEFDASIYDASRSDVERAISLDPSRYQAHYLLGNVLLKLGESELATAEYRTSLNLAPNQPRTYYHLALALRAEHKEADEVEILAKAIALDNQYALAHCELGRILLDQGRLTDAVTELNLAIQDNASSEQAYSLLSRAYERLGDTAKSEAMAEQLAIVRRSNHKVSQKGSLPEDTAREQANP